MSGTDTPYSQRSSQFQLCCWCSLYLGVHMNPVIKLLHVSSPQCDLHSDKLLWSHVSLSCPMNSVILETQASLLGGQSVSSSGNTGSEASLLIRKCYALCRMGAAGLNQKGCVISSQCTEFTSLSTGTLNTFGDTHFIFKTEWIVHIPRYSLHCRWNLKAQFCHCFARLYHFLLLSKFIYLFLVCVSKILLQQQ